MDKKSQVITSSRALEKNEAPTPIYFKSISKTNKLNQTHVKRIKKKLTNQQQHRTLPFVDHDNKQPVNTEICLKFNRAFQFLKWNEHEEQSFIDFEIRLCTALLIPHREIETLVQSHFHNKHVQKLLYQLESQINKNIINYIARSPELKETLNPEIQKYERINKKIHASKNLGIPLTDVELGNKMILMLRSKKSRQCLIQHCFLVLHYISCKLGNYPEIISYFETSSYCKNIKQNVFNDKDPNLEQYPLLGIIMTAMTLIFIKYNKIQNNGSDVQSFIDFVRITIELRIKYERIDQDFLIESPSTSKNDKITDTHLQSFTLTIFLFYKHIQLVSRYIPQFIHISRDTYYFSTLSLINRYKKICRSYLDVLKERQFQYTKMVAPKMYSYEQKASLQRNKQACNKFREKVNFLIEILENFEQKIWGQESINAVKEDQTHNSEQKKRAYSQSKTLLHSRRKYTGQRSLSSLFKEPKQKKDNIKEWMEQRYFKDIKTIGETKSQKSFTKKKRNDSCSTMIDNVFESTKNAIKLIDLEIKIKMDSCNSNQQQETVKTVNRIKPRKKPMTNKQRSKIYEKFQNNKKMVTQISEADFLRERLLVEELEFYDSKKQKKYMRDTIVSCIPSWNEQTPQPKVSQLANEYPTKQETIKLVKYINFKPTVIKVNVMLCAAHYIIKITLLDTPTQRNFEIILPKRNNIFTGRFETIWPTMNYIFKKKIMNYWVFSQNEMNPPTVFKSGEQKKKTGKARKEYMKESTILKLFGPISEEEYEIISSALANLVKFIDILIFKETNSIGRRLFIKEIYNEKASNICIAKKPVKVNQVFANPIQHIMNNKKKKKNLNSTIISMKEEIVLLGNQRITLGMSTVKVKDTYRFMQKKPISNYNLIFLVINSFSLLSIFEKDTVDLKVIIEPFNELEVQKSFQTFNNQRRQRPSNQLASGQKNSKTNQEREIYPIEINLEDLKTHDISRLMLVEQICCHMTGQSNIRNLYCILMKISFDKHNFWNRFTGEEFQLKTYNDLCPQLFYDRLLAASSKRSEIQHQNKVIENCFNFEFSINKSFSKSVANDEAIILEQSTIKTTKRKYRAKPQTLKNKSISYLLKLTDNPKTYVPGNKPTNYLKIKKKTSLNSLVLLTNKINKTYKLDIPDSIGFQGSQNPEEPIKKLHIQVKLNKQLNRKRQDQLSILIYFSKFKRLNILSINLKDINILSSQPRIWQCYSNAVLGQKKQEKGTYQTINQIIQLVVPIRKSLVPKIAIKLQCLQCDKNETYFLHSKQYITNKSNQAFYHWPSSSVNHHLQLSNSINDSFSVWDKSKISNISVNMSYDSIVNNSIKHSQQNHHCNNTVQQCSEADESRSSGQIQQKNDSNLTSERSGKKFESRKILQKVKEMVSLQIVKTTIDFVYLATVPFKRRGGFHNLLSVKILVHPSIVKQPEKMSHGNMMVQLQITFLGLEHRVCGRIQLSQFLQILLEDKDHQIKSHTVYFQTYSQLVGLATCDKDLKTLPLTSKSNEIMKKIKQFLLQVKLNKTDQQKYIFSYRNWILGQCELIALSKYDQQHAEYSEVIFHSKRFLNKLLQEDRGTQLQYCAFSHEPEMMIDQNLLDPSDSLSIARYVIEDHSLCGFAEEDKGGQQNYMEAYIQKERIIKHETIEHLIKQYKLQDQYCFYGQQLSKISLQKLIHYLIKK